MEFLEADDILVPLRIDITHKGSHFIDTFTWNLYNSISSIEEFTVKLCSDYNLPVTFISLIILQLQQQIDCYNILFSLLQYNYLISSHFNLSVNSLLSYFNSIIIELNIRHNVLEYNDKFQWNIHSNICSPEKFAQITCSDLGLSPEMEPTIAYNIRENIIRQLLKFIDDSNSTSQPITSVDIVSSLNLSLISSKNVVDMSTSLWKDTKPISSDFESFGNISYNENEISNSNIWQNE